MFQLCSNVVFDNEDECNILVDIKSGKFYQLNDMSTFILNRVVKGNSLSSIAKDIASCFDVNEDHAQKDMLQFLNHLVSLELMTE